MKFRMTLVLSMAALAAAFASPQALAHTPRAAGHASTAAPAAPMINQQVYRCQSLTSLPDDSIAGDGCTPRTNPEGSFMMQGPQGTYFCDRGGYVGARLFGIECERVG
ncbi:hypothetical protein [Kitasatospora brasiliensis]|uniref:hypothetical protein n=1 Tax=Kitasatospora brasiliensis TaxID=3058040 RepID=UPI00292EDCDE|nr:hypothetical protein [Kitasatospora sp. K002]